MSCRGYVGTPQSARAIANQGGTADMFYSSLTKPNLSFVGDFCVQIELEMEMAHDERLSRADKGARTMVMLS